MRSSCVRALSRHCSLSSPTAIPSRSAVASQPSRSAMSVPSKLAGALADEEGIDSVAGVAEDVAAGREGLELWAPREALELMALGLAAGFGGGILRRFSISAKRRSSAARRSFILGWPIPPMEGSSID